MSDARWTTLLIVLGIIVCLPLLRLVITGGEANSICDDIGEGPYS